MQTLKPLIPITLCLLAACSEGASTAQSHAGANAAPAAASRPTAAADGTAQANACDVITASDVAGIFTVPVVAESPNSLNPRMCGYEVPGKASIDITVSRGEDAQDGWKTEIGLGGQPYPGFGDRAMHQSDTELSVMQGDVLCGVGLTENNRGEVTKGSGDKLLHKLGALCNKVFASH